MAKMENALLLCPSHRRIYCQFPYITFQVAFFLDADRSNHQLESFEYESVGFYHYARFADA